VSTGAAVLVIDMQIGLVNIAYEGHEVLQIITYHNSVLPAVAHPDRRLIVKRSRNSLLSG
jgi:hypothetical protein